MTAGQAALALGAISQHAEAGAAQRIAVGQLLVRPRVLRASEAEMAAHAARLDTLDKASGEGSLWRRLEPEDEQPA
jgi:DNA polymerase-3 subunit epsilon